MQAENQAQKLTASQKLKLYQTILRKYGHKPDKSIEDEFSRAVKMIEGE